MKLRAKDPCPCGIGALYGDCHGRFRTPDPEPRAPRIAGPARVASVLAAMNALTKSDAPATDARPVLVLENHLDPALCRMLVEGFERNVARVQQATADPYWSERLLYYQALTHEPEMRRVMREAREAEVREIRAFYDVDAPLYSDTVHLVRWREGQSMRAHADNAHLDGRPNDYPWRDYASVAYLNEDFDGGEIFFERNGLRVKPRTGMLVAFPGGIDHVHGVTEVTRGTRYTMPAWHTLDASRRDKDFD